MTKKQAEFLLASVIIARSTGYLFTKIAMEGLQTFNLLALRFVFAFLLLVVLFGHKLKGLHMQTIVRGMIIGGLYTAVMAAELYGLQMTDTATISFLENAAIVFVPLFEAVLYRKLPKLKVLIGTCVAFAGIGCLTIGRNGGTISIGCLVCLLSAVLYAIAIIVTDRFARNDDAFVLGILQVGFMGIFSTFLTFAIENPRLPVGTKEWIMVLLLVIICSGFGFTLQPLAQKHVSAERTGMFCALNPLAATVLGGIFLKERLGVYGVVGCVLILMGIVLPSCSKRN